MEDLAHEFLAVSPPSLVNDADYGSVCGFDRVSRINVHNAVVLHSIPITASGEDFSLQLRPGHCSAGDRFVSFTAGVGGTVILGRRRQVDLQSENILERGCLLARIRGLDRGDRKCCIQLYRLLLCRRKPFLNWSSGRIFCILT
jgi:hypothetical protein